MKHLVYLLPFLFLVGCSGPSSTPPRTGDRAPETAVAEPETPYLNASPEEFAELIGRPNTVIVDVRTPAETRNGVIDGALELDFRSPTFEQSLGELPRDKTYLVYCASGGRSSQTCERMADLGFEQVYNLEGGYSAWIEE